MRMTSCCGCCHRHRHTAHATIIINYVESDRIGAKSRLFIIIIFDCARNACPPCGDIIIIVEMLVCPSSICNGAKRTEQTGCTWLAQHTRARYNGILIGQTLVFELRACSIAHCNKICLHFCTHVPESKIKTNRKLIDI